MRNRLYLYDDATARGWAPFAQTRPVGELLFGALLLRERAERAVGARTVGYLTTDGLDGFSEAGAPPVLSTGDLHGEGRVVVLSTRYVPPLPDEQGPIEALTGATGRLDGRALRLEAGGEVVGWIEPAGLEGSVFSGGTGPDPVQTVGSPESPPLADLDAVEIPGIVLARPWDLVDRNPDRLDRDLEALLAPASRSGVRALGDAPGVHRIGAHPVTIEGDVTLDPGVVLDGTEGPIHLARGVRVRPFTHLRGPAIIGRGTTLLGGVFEAVSCGPVCKLRGEIEASVVLGYSNKAHDGYLGHSMLGRWVNLGAFTTNSDLKNNYGSMRVADPGGEVDTGLLKLGIFLGDHVKTGIGTLLTGGTIVGVGSNLFGGRMPPKWVPPFSWGSGSELGIHREDAFLRTAERAMGRRDVALTPEHRAFLTNLWTRIHGTGPEPSGR